MAEKLRKLTLVAVPRGMIVNTQAFRQGLTDGLTAEDNGFDIRQTTSEDVLVDIVCNLLDLHHEGILTDHRLRHDIGMIVGYVTRNISTSYRTTESRSTHADQ